MNSAGVPFLYSFRPIIVQSPESLLGTTTNSTNVLCLRLCSSSACLSVPSHSFILSSTSVSWWSIPVLLLLLLSLSSTSTVLEMRHDRNLIIWSHAPKTTAKTMEIIRLGLRIRIRPLFVSTVGGWVSHEGAIIEWGGGGHCVRNLNCNWQITRSEC